MTAVTIPVSARTGSDQRWSLSARRFTERISAWGLELGEESFALSRVMGAPGRPRMKRGGRVEMPRGAGFAADGALESWVRALTGARREDPHGSREVVASLPGSQVDTYPLRVEATEPSAYLAELAAQAAERLPYPLGEAIVDTIEIDDAAPSTSGGRRVILVAAREHAVAFALDLMREAGFHPLALEIPATALARLHRLLDAESPPALLVSIGDASTTIACAHAGAACVTRAIPWGRSLLYARLEETLKIPRAGAERCLAGLAAGDTGREMRVVSTLVSPLVDELALEVEKVWTYASSEFRDRGPQRILISGTPPLAPVAAAHLRAMIEQPVLVLDPAACLPGASAELAVSLGLALRDSPWLPAH